MVCVSRSKFSKTVKGGAECGLTAAFVFSVRHFWSVGPKLELASEPESTKCTIRRPPGEGIDARNVDSRRPGKPSRRVRRLPADPRALQPCACREPIWAR